MNINLFLVCFKIFTATVFCSQEIEFDELNFSKIEFSEGSLEYKVDTSKSNVLIEHPTHTYLIRGRKARLNTVSFKQTDSVFLRYKEITLNRGTSFSEMKKLFPKSYKSRNIGTSPYRAMLDDIDSYQYDFINLYSESGKVKILQLVFINSKLEFAEFTYLGTN